MRGGRYYTRSRRVGGRVVREYVGSGPVAQLAARLDARERAEREAERRAHRAERDRLEAADVAVAELCDLSEALASGALLLAASTGHDRGEWRKRRGQSQSGE